MASVFGIFARKKDKEEIGKANWHMCRKHMIVVYKVGEK